MPSLNEAIPFYTSRYYFTDPLFLRPGQKKIVLGDSSNPICRFCGRHPPEATFKSEAHAIPEALGNKSITTAYECDECNQTFGRGIEDELGKWSKPSRTFARIRGKSGVPTLIKGGPEPGWRIEFGPNGFEIRQYEDDPIFEVDEARKQVRFTLKRDTYTPVAVLKALVKIGLTLMPDEEMANFPDTLAWIREPDHSKIFVREFWIFYTFQQGPMPNDLIVAWLLRRKPKVTDAPYAFLILAYGNEIFQVPLPSPQQDAVIDGQTLQMPVFPTPEGPDPLRYGASRTRLLDLTGRTPVKGEMVSFVFGFDQVTRKVPNGSPPA